MPSEPDWRCAVKLLKSPDFLKTVTITFSYSKSSQKNIRFIGNSQDKSDKCNNINDLVLPAQKVFAYFLSYIIIYLNTVRLNFIKQYLKSPHPVLLAALLCNERTSFPQREKEFKRLINRCLPPLGVSGASAPKGGMKFMFEF